VTTGSKAPVSSRRYELEHCFLEPNPNVPSPALVGVRRIFDETVPVGAASADARVLTVGTSLAQARASTTHLLLGRPSAAYRTRRVSGSAGTRRIRPPMNAGRLETGWLDAGLRRGRVGRAAARAPEPTLHELLRAVA
jgi:hypothetical protein